MLIKNGKIFKTFWFILNIKFLYNKKHALAALKEIQLEQKIKGKFQVYKLI